MDYCYCVYHAHLLIHVQNLLILISDPIWHVPCVPWCTAEQMTRNDSDLHVFHVRQTANCSLWKYQGEELQHLPTSKMNKAWGKLANVPVFCEGEHRLTALMLESLMSHKKTVSWNCSLWKYQGEELQHLPMSKLMKLSLRCYNKHWLGDKWMVFMMINHYHFLTPRDSIAMKTIKCTLLRALWKHFSKLKPNLFFSSTAILTDPRRLMMHLLT